jgi:ABC-type molybdate transport system substrate-binding protein
MSAASIIAAGASLLSAAVGAAEINVISTQATQHKVKTLFNGTLNVQKRLADGEPYDLIIMASPAIDEQIKRGEAEIGFQQVSELVHFQGIDFVGPLPVELQRMTSFSAGLHSGAKERDAAKALVKLLTAPAAAPVIRKHGLEPA